MSGRSLQLSVVGVIVGKAVDISQPVDETRSRVFGHEWAVAVGSLCAGCEWDGRDKRRVDGDGGTTSAC